MKKICLALALLLVFTTLFSCGGGEKAAKTYSFSTGGNELCIDAEIDESLLTALGTQTKAPEEAPNCAFDGKDLLYSYAGFELETYPLNGKNYIYGVYLTDDSEATKEGITIGASADAVKVAYGDATVEKEASLTYEGKGMSLIFFLRDGKVTQIQYLKKA